MTKPLVSAIVVESGSRETAERETVYDGIDELLAPLAQLGTLEPEVWRIIYLYQNNPETKGNFAAVSRRLGITSPTVARRYDRHSALVNKATAKNAAEHRQQLAELEPEHDDRDRSYESTAGAPELTNAK
ncbi:hypothetical protein CH274_15250 [Rhodococcus sp. 06-418-5]|uniref:hypothetical protein n=1 Tax=Rhodococcus sp. 06-418-5 TaxID=2022507 RepID=UPI000B9C6267|nr:hypothetical protein [Rhodococcus sp. 06-418-5]OZC80526.1 hypothetical protein CH274_15250 [Rhodococcus sp. 06-418-5]